MKRNQFIVASLAMATGLMTPLKLLARKVATTGKGFLVPAGKDRKDQPLPIYEGDMFYAKVTTEDSGGSFYLIETTRDKKGGPPLHLHYDQDEWWYVLEGEFDIKVGDQLYHAKPGDSVFGPRNVPHAMAKVNDGPARLMILYQPAGLMEEYFKKTSAGIPQKMTKEEQAAFRKAHGLELVGPALGYLKQ